MQESILVFGGGSLQLSIINRAKLMGYRTIVIDPDNNAPGRNTSDLFIQVEGDDFEKTMQIAFENKIKGILTAATDKPVLMMCRIAKELNLPFPSFESCETVLDKAQFKKFLIYNNLPHARGNEFIGEIDVASVNLDFPVIIKPVMNSGSRGVLRCDNHEELISAIKETLQHCKDDRYLIEEFIEGDEISVEVLVQNKKVYLIQLTDKIITSPPYNVELGHIQPSKYEYLKSVIEQLIQTIVDKTGLDNCALHPELKISKDKITIIEIGPRLGGDFITSHLVPLSTGINIEDQLINISVGKSISYKLENNASMVSFLNFPVGEKIINSISEIEIKQRFPLIQYFKSELKPNDKISQITNSLNRYGEYIIKGSSVEKLISENVNITSFLYKTLFSHSSL